MSSDWKLWTLLHEIILSAVYLFICSVVWIRVFLIRFRIHSAIRLPIETDYAMEQVDAVTFGAPEARFFSGAIGPRCLVLHLAEKCQFRQWNVERKRKMIRKRLREFFDKFRNTSLEKRDFRHIRIKFEPFSSLAWYSPVWRESGRLRSLHSSIQLTHYSYTQITLPLADVAWCILHSFNRLLFIAGFYSI